MEEQAKFDGKNTLKHKRQHFIVGEGLKHIIFIRNIFYGEENIQLWNEENLSELEEKT